MTKSIVMVGDNLEGPGGISAVVRTYRECGFFVRWQIVYHSNFDSPGLPRQAWVMSKGLTAFLGLALLGKVSFTHLHSGPRGSFWRATMFSYVARLFRIPYLLHVHSGEFSVFFYEECGPLAKAIVRSVLDHAALVFSLTLGWKYVLGRIAPNANLVVLPNPIVLPRAPSGEVRWSSPMLLFLGGIVEEKGVYDLLRAMPQVIRAQPQCKLVLAGRGELDKAKHVVVELGIERAVEFAGWVSGAAKERLLREATIVVLPSHFEAFPVVLLEAMAYGKAVVATKVGGIPEVITDGKHGVLVPPSDPRALANALVALIADGHSLRTMGAAGYEHVCENFSATKVIATLDEFYRLIGAQHLDAADLARKG